MAGKQAIKFSPKQVFALGVLFVLFVLFVAVGADSGFVLNLADPAPSSVPNPGHSSVDIVVNVSGSGACSGDISLQDAIDNACLVYTEPYEGYGECAPFCDETVSCPNGWTEVLSTEGHSCEARSTQVTIQGTLTDLRIVNVAGPDIPGGGARILDTLMESACFLDGMCPGCGNPLSCADKDYAICAIEDEDSGWSYQPSECIWCCR